MFCGTGYGNRIHLCLLVLLLANRERGDTHRQLSYIYTNKQTNKQTEPSMDA